MAELLVNAIRFLTSLRGELHIGHPIASAGPKVYLCTSDQLAQTGGERPPKMKSPQTPFLTTP
jgi:hypothetical protein